MMLIDWIVLAGGTLAVLAVNWYFFAAERAAAARAARSTEPSAPSGGAR